MPVCVWYAFKLRVSRVRVSFRFSLSFFYEPRILSVFAVRILSSFSFFSFLLELGFGLVLGLGLGFGLVLGLGFGLVYA